NSIIKTYMIGNRKLIVFSNPPNNNNNDLIQFNESFEPEEYWEEEELYKIIENDNDLIQGNIYTVIDKSLRNINGYGLFFMIGRYYGKGYSNNNDHTRGHARFISASNIYFDNNEWSYRDKFGRYIRESTQEEKEWFLKCEKQGKFIPNPKFHINESFEPIEEWEEELSDEIKISEMIVGEIYVMRAEDGKIIFRFDGFNNKVKYHINTKSVIFHLENEDGIEEHKYKDIPVPLIKDDMDEIVYLPSKSEIKEIENYENNINESFEPEEEWDEGFYIIPGKAYLVKKKDWSEFSEILNDNGYKWGGSGEITKDWFVDIYVPDRYSKECVIYPVIINGGIKSITRSSLDYYYDEYSYNKELIKFNGLYESFNPEEEWGENLPLEYNKIYKIPINHYI
ncbi:MAG: hypothetical protein KDH96_11325, partial [Candidatus Riesia sp.]|nr:hypothetical protein [Candidatus Riesia sp.]